MDSEEPLPPSRSKHPIFWVAILLIIFNAFLFLGKTVYDNRKAKQNEPADSETDSVMYSPKVGEVDLHVYRSVT